MASNRLDQRRMDDNCDQSIDRIKSIRWFCRAGLPGKSFEHASAEAYLRDLGFRDLDIRFVQNLKDAEQILQMKFDSRWQHAEVTRARRLHESVSDHGPRIFNRIFEVTFEPIMQQASKQISSNDSYLNRVAAGSAAESCFLYTLETMGQQPESVNFGQPFKRKLEIFEHGRWPLCMKDGTFAIY